MLDQEMYDKIGLEDLSERDLAAITSSGKLLDTLSEFRRAAIRKCEAEEHLVHLIKEYDRTKGAFEEALKTFYYDVNKPMSRY